MTMKVWVIFSQQEEGYSPPFKAFSSEEAMNKFRDKYIDAYGLRYCFE